MSDQPTISSKDVSVIIPVHRAGEALRQCLGALADATPCAGEVIVVADGAGDGSWRSIVAESNVRLIELPRQVGAAAARNAAVEQAKGAILFFVDADVTIAPDAIAQVVTSFNEHPEWSAIFGSYDDAPGAANFVAQYKGLLNHYVHQHARDEAFTFWTALGAIRKDVFLTMGGLDPHHRLEDIEFGYRLRSAGHRIGVRKTLLGKHLKQWTAGSLIRSDFFDRALPWTQLMLQTKSAEKDLHLDTRSRLSVAIVGLLLLSPAVALWQPLTAGLLAIAVVATLLLLNAPLYRFFARKRGLLFMLAAIPWHWLYFFYGGLAFAIGLVLHLCRRPVSAAPRLERAPLMKVAS